MITSDLIAAIKALGVPGKFRDDTPYTSLSSEKVSTLTKQFDLGGKWVEIAALENGVVPERYIRNMRTLSLKEQATLLRSRVSVVGLGGLGGGVVEILARVGVGALNLADGDSFEDSNLNRQLLSTHKGLSTAKAVAAVDRVSAINASTDVKAYTEFLDDGNAARLLEGSDAVVDCLDSLKFRFILEKACKAAGVPLVSAAVAGLTGHVTTIFPKDPGLELIYGKSDRTPEKGAEAVLGTLPPCVTVLSALEASEIVKLLLRKGALLRNKLLVIDLLDNTLEVLRLQQ